MIQRETQNSKLEYALIIAAFYFTGGAFSGIHYNVKTTIFFITSLVICFVLRRYRFSKNAIVTIVASSFFILLPCLIFHDKVSTYIGIMMQLCIGLFCARIIPIRNFISKYVDIMVVFAAISLVGFSIGLIFPSIALIFPVVDNIEMSSVNYYNAFVYVFMAFKGYSSLVLTSRNAGICWEPGCYQMFLNLALFFLLDMMDNGKIIDHKKFIIKLVILVVAILTTVSTTGYILLVVIIIAFRKTLFRNEKMRTWIPIVLIIVFLAWQFFGIQGSMIEKMNREFVIRDSNSQTVASRISIDTIPYIFTESFFIGMGFSRWLTFGISIWNSIFHSFLCLGTPFTIIHLVSIFYGCKKMSCRYWILFLVIVISAFTETLFWRILFNIVAAYGTMVIGEDGVSI